MSKNENIKVGISVGDINGIGLEIILKSFADKRMLDFCTPIIFASNKVVSFHKKELDLDTPIHGIQAINQAIPGKLNLVNVWKEEVNVVLGKSSKSAGKYAFLSLEAATNALKNKEIDVMVTAPINKDNTQSNSFNFPGQTEYLAKNLGEDEPLMVLMTDEIRLGLITAHIPISKVSSSITPELIKRKVAIFHKSLIQDFGIEKPKIAILGLNPHCGDKGVIGNEDDDIVKPTLAAIQEDGIMVFGPYSADSFFGTKLFSQFDGVLAMYHDQGLAPFKAISFGRGVNFTAGINGIRTSPDHGTAYEIAGKGIAEETSFKEALFAAIQIYNTRTEYLALVSNRLE